MAKYKRARILSVGTCVPDNVMPNAEFETFLDTSDEWIWTRTGIRQRYIAPKDKDIQASELGTEAAKVAMQRAGVKAEQIDGIVCATFTPDSLFPSTACAMQAQLGCKNAYAFDISAACAGFVYGLNVANGLILSGQATTILVVGSEVISKVLDWTDRTTCILFGDGAGAVVLQGTGSENGIISTYMGSDGTLGSILELPVWGENRTMRMKGNEVFKHAVRMMSDASLRVMDSAGIPLDKLDLFIPHQANIRIIKSVSDQLGVPSEKVVTNVDRYGNTSSASIPIALDDAWSGGRVKEGVHALFTSLGGGVTVASALIQF